jgi:uncharacterized membrane protein YgcG
MVVGFTTTYTISAYYQVVVCLLAIIALAVALAIVVTKKIDDVNEPSPTIATNSGSGSQTGGGGSQTGGNGCQTSGGGSNTNSM